MHLPSSLSEIKMECGILHDLFFSSKPRSIVIFGCTFQKQYKKFKWTVESITRNIILGNPDIFLISFPNTSINFSLSSFIIKLLSNIKKVIIVLYYCKLLASSLVMITHNSYKWVSRCSVLIKNRRISRY